jgi:protein O-mannosyl-transferase
MNRTTVILILGAILLVWTALVFLPARHFEFVDFDDFNEVVQNPLLFPATNASLAAIWSGPHLEMYAPLSYSAWWAMERTGMAGDNPAGFHLLNIALHLICVALVFSIVMVCVKSPAAAFGGAAIFALHPVQVESVAWVSEMNNLLAAAFSLAAIRLYLAFRMSPTKHRWWFYGLASAVFLLALFAKATAVVAPLIVVILDWGFLHTSPRRVIAAILPWFLAAGVFSWIAHASQPASATPLVDRPAVAIDALAFYYGTLFWPTRLTVDYGRTPSRVLMGHLWVGNLFLIAVLCLILWFVWKNSRGVTLGAMVMLTGVLPVLGLVPFEFQEYSTVADHFLYMGMLGPALAGAVMLAAAPKWLGPMIAVALTALLAVLSAKQLPVWTNSGTLVARALMLDRGSAIANGIVGAVWDKENKPDAAIPFFNKAIARDPTHADYHYNLANALFRMKEYEKSVDEYQTAIGLFRIPSWRAVNNLGVAYVKLGEREKAIDQFRQVLKIDPQNAEAMKNLRILGADVATQ